MKPSEAWFPTQLYPWMTLGECALSVSEIQVQSH